MKHQSIGTLLEFITVLTEREACHRFVRLTPKTLFYQDLVDTVFVHIEHPPTYVYNGELDDYMPNPEPYFKVSVFSEGPEVVNQSALLEITSPVMWEEALQEVVQRF